MCFLLSSRFSDDPLMTWDVNRDRRALLTNNFRTTQHRGLDVQLVTENLQQLLRKRAVVDNVMHCLAGHLQLAPLHFRFRSAHTLHACVHAATPLHSGDGNFGAGSASEVQIPAPGVCDAAQCTSRRSDFDNQSRSCQHQAVHHPQSCFFFRACEPVDGHRTAEHNYGFIFLHSALVTAALCVCTVGGVAA